MGKGEKEVYLQARYGNRQPEPEQGSGIGGAVQEILLGNGRRQGMLEAMGKSAVRTVGNQIGRQIIRGVLGGFMRR